MSGLSGDENLQLIDQGLEQSPRSDDDASPLVVRAAQSIEDAQSEHVESTFIILDSGSDVSLLPRSYVPDNLHGASHRLKDCQGNALGHDPVKHYDCLAQGH